MSTATLLSTRHVIIHLTLSLLFLCVGWGTFRSASAQDLQIELTAERSPAAPETPVSFALVVSNTAASEISGVVAEVDLPDDISVFNISTTTDASNVVCNTVGFNSQCSPGETLVWTVGTLDGGESRTLLYRVSVASMVAPGTLLTTAEATASNQSTATSSATVVISESPTVTVALSGSPGPAAAGSAYTYRIDYGVIAETQGAENALLQLRFPDGVTFQSASDGGTEENGVVMWSLGALDPGSIGERTVTVVVASDLPDGELLRASATLESGNSGDSSAQSGFVVAVYTPGPLQLALSMDGIPARPDGRVDFSLTVANTGGLTAAGTTVQLLLPRFVKTFAENTTTDPSGVQCNTRGFNSECSPGEVLVWTVGDLDAGESRTLFFETDIRGDAVLGNLGQVYGLARSSRGIQQTFSDHFGIDEAPVHLGLSVEEGPVAAGSSLTYRLDYSAAFGSQGAVDPVLLLDLPDGVTFQSASEGGTQVGESVQWALGPIDEGDGGEVTATVEVASGVDDGTLLRSRASFQSGNAGASIARSTHSVPVYEARPLRVALSAGEIPAVRGERVRFALTVSNTFGLLISGTTVRLVLPEFINRFAEDTTTDPTGVQCNTLGFSSECSRNEVLVWTVGELESGESRTVLFDARVSSDTNGGEILRLRGTASASRGIQQVFSANFGLETEPVMSLGLSGENGPVASGLSYTYYLDYGARFGRGGANAPVLQLQLPENVVFEEATGGGVESNGVVTWQLESLNGGEGGERAATVTVGPNLIPGETLRARASLDPGVTGRRGAQASYVTTVGTSPLQLQVSATDPSPLPGGEVTYTIEATNNSGLALTNTVVRVVLPEFIQTFDEDVIGDPRAQCNTLGFSSQCSAREIIVWTVGEIPSGSTETLSFDPRLRSEDQSLGDLLRNRYTATADGVQQRYGGFDLPIVDVFTLPVELTSFTASLEGEAVALAWSTATETNNAGFDVERSTDGETFTAIGFEPGVGTTEEAQSYRFVDRDAPFATTLFYRLRQVDTDGTFEYSPVVEVQVKPSAVALLPVAPNPVVGVANLRYELPEATAVRLQVFDLLGRRVATLADGEKPAGRHAVTWTGSRLAPGTYFVRLEAGSTAQTQMLRLVR